MIPNPSPTPPPAARLSGVRKTYGDVVALDGLDLEVRPGEVLGLLGPNGAGKTTTIGLLLGLLRPDRGRAELFGRDSSSRGARARVGAMLQVGRLPDTLRVRELVDLFSSYYPRPLPRAEVLAVAGLEEVRNRLFGRLSGGQQRRVLFALAICGDPSLIFLDEPTAGLDVEARRALWRRIGCLAERGSSVVLTTHHLEEADALSDRIVVLHRGATLAEGTPDEIKARVHRKRIRCRTSLDRDTLRRLPGVLGVEPLVGRFEILTARPEPLLRELLSRDPDLTDLEVVGAGLEEAFLSITREPEADTVGEEAA